MDGWDELVERHSYDDSWRQNYHAFHAYDLATNIEMPRQRLSPRRPSRGPSAPSGWREFIRFG